MGPGNHRHANRRCSEICAEKLVNRVRYFKIGGCGRWLLVASSCCHGDRDSAAEGLGDIYGDSIENEEMFTFISCLITID